MDKQLANARQNGFTLVELILAISLLGLVMVLAYTGLRTGIKTADSGSKLVERTNQVRVAHQFVRGQIRRVLPLVMETDDDEHAIMFEGQADEMRFVAPMPGYLGDGGPHVQILKLESGGGAKALMFDHYLLNQFEDPQDQDRPPILLLDQIEDARFVYMGLDEEGELTDWQDEWEDPSLVPVMIAVEMSMREDSRLDWPDLVVSPVIDVSSGRVSGGQLNNRRSRRTDREGGAQEGDTSNAAPTTQAGLFSEHLRNVRNRGGDGGNGGN